MIEYHVLRETDSKVLCLSVRHSVVFEAGKDLWQEYRRRSDQSLLESYFATMGLNETPDTSPNLDEAVDFTNLILNLTNQCNFSCAYCYRAQGLSQAMSFNIFTKAIALISTCFNKERTNIAFFGGEPLLLFERIQEMVAHAEKTLTGRQLTFSITTNGSLITPVVAHFLADRRFNVIVSLDSFQDVNTTIRRSKRENPEAIYRTIVDGIELLVSLGVDIACNVMLTTYNVANLADFITYLIQLGLKRITLSLVANRSYPFTPVLRDQLLHEEARIIDLLFNNPAITIEPFTSLMNLLRAHQVRLYRCGYGRQRINVQPTGEITACHRVSVPLGTVHEGLDLELSREIAKCCVEHRPQCSRCPFRYLCGGNCYHESLVYENDLDRPYIPYCDLFARRVAALSERMIADKPCISVKDFKAL